MGEEACEACELSNEYIAVLEAALCDGVSVVRDGNQWCARPSGFVNLMTHDVGWGTSVYSAVVAFTNQPMPLRDGYVAAVATQKARAALGSSE